MSKVLKYQPEIDGLRCFAVLSVIFYHVQKSWLPGGYLGVDVFFVISGYLITSIIIKEIDSDSFTFLGFWDRRIKRILPLAVFVLLIVSILHGFFLFRQDLYQFKYDKIASLLSYANIHIWLDKGSYWGADSESSPFLHYWSLSLEEQYYVIYPIVFFLLTTYLQRFRNSALSVTVVFSFMLFIYGAMKFPGATFYLLPTRVWELGAGCLLACFLSNRPPLKRRWMTLLGLLLLGVVFIFPVNKESVGLEALGAVIAAVLIILGGSNQVSKLVLENKVSLFIGKISYSLYLWHWPLIVSLRTLKDYEKIELGATAFIVGGIALVLVSVFSFYVIERPFRKMKYGSFIVLAIACCAGTYFMILEKKVFPLREVERFDRPTSYGFYYDIGPKKEDTFGGQLTKEALNMPMPQRQLSLDAYKQGGIIRLRAEASPRLVLLGDSHGKMWSKVLDEVSGDLNITTSLWAMNAETAFMKLPREDNFPANHITETQKWEYDSTRLEFIKKWKPEIVVLVARWENVSSSRMMFFFNFLEKHAGRVLLIESPPLLHGLENRNFYQYANFLDLNVSSEGCLLWDKYDLEAMKRNRGKVLRQVYERENFSYLPVADLYMSEEGVLAGRERKIYYLDNDHITYEGTLLAKERISKAIDNVLSGKGNSFPIVGKQGGEADEILQATSITR